MRSGRPALAEEVLDHRFGYVFEPAWPPARRVVLVDEHGAHPLDEVALFKAVRSHAELHPKACGEIHGCAALQLTQSHAHHRGRAAARAQAAYSTRISESSDARIPKTVVCEKCASIAARNAGKVAESGNGDEI